MVTRRATRSAGPAPKPRSRPTCAADRNGETLEVDPTGRQVGPPRDVRPGTLGHDVYLTIDANVQRVAEESLLQGIASARRLKNDNVVKRYEKLKATSGAVIVLDVTDGSVIAMASFPSYDPSMFVGGITQKEYDALQDPANANPLLNRATDGLYAPGSTFKLVTAVATTRYGVRSASQSYLDRGYYETGDKRRLYNAKKSVFGPVNLSRAITVSSDAYFYSAGNEFWKRWKAGDTQSGLGIQTVAKEFGFGEPTGIELGEVTGLVPDPQWKHDFVRAYYKSEADKRANEPLVPRRQHQRRDRPGRHARRRRCNSPMRTRRSRTAGRVGSRISGSR